MAIRLLIKQEINVSANDLIEETLVGWEDPQKKLKEAGINIEGFGDTTRDYYNKTMRLSLEAHTKEKYLRFHILRKDDEAGTTLIIKYKDDDQLKAILQTITGHQQSVDEKNFRELVADLMKAGSEVSAETED